MYMYVYIPDGSRALMCTKFCSSVRVILLRDTGRWIFNMILMLPHCNRDLICRTTTETVTKFYTCVYLDFSQRPSVRTCT